MNRTYRAAVLQFVVDMGAVDVNVTRALRLLREAADRGAALSVLPEMWSTGFHYEGLPALCGSTPEILEELRRFAADRAMVIAGSLPEGVGKSVCNTLYVIDASGAVAGAYRKAHLFSPSGENLHFRRGTTAEIARTAVGAVGPLICYDLRFPELSRKYFLDGAVLFCVSAQWPSIRRAHWELLTVARAVENQLFVAAANATGRSGDFHYVGGSAIVSPLGERIADAGEGEGIALAEIDPSMVAEFRRRIPCADDRNERAYRRTRRGK
ncbi:MAG: nitrilase-related carbon-nitrogen hydrolase [Gemmatimonadota bacterium]